MLILLSERIRDRVTELVMEQRFRNAIELLALGHRQGRHIVAARPSVLRALVDHLPAREAQIWREISDSHEDLETLRSHVSHLCIVEPEPTGPVRRERDPSGQVRFHVAYTYFDELERVSAARLVAEDDDDAVIYDAAARAYVVAERFGAAHIALQCFGGSGRNIDDALRSHAKHGLTVCLADSDKKWPEAPDGETLHALRKAYKELETKYVVEVIDLPCHELENLLPPALVLESLMRNDRDLQTRCEIARDLGFMASTAPLHHLDLKNGLRLRDVLRAEKPTQRAFLREVFDQHQAKVTCPEGGFCEEAEPPCKVEKERETCRCILFAGLTSKCASRVADLCRNRSSQDDVATLADSFFSPNLPCRDTWLSLCRQIFSFACAYPRARL